MCQQIPRDIHKNQNRCEAMYKDVEKLEGQMCFSKKKKKDHNKERGPRRQESPRFLFIVLLLALHMKHDHTVINT